MSYATADTRRLTRADVELRPGWRRSSPWRLALCGLGVLALLLGALRFAAPVLERDADYARLQTQNDELAGRLEAADQQLKLERAAHGELERQVASLQGELQELNQQLEFLATRSAPR
jgi:hypothetical protein